MKIEQAITKFCVAKGIEVTKERVDIHSGYLKKSGFSDGEIVSALGELFGETEFFPDASLVLKKLKPSGADNTAHAQAMVDKIMEANSMFGSPLEVKEFIGPEAWNIVERFGGWSCITNLTYSDLGTARAQLRRIAESQVIVKNTNKRIEQSDNSSSSLERVDFRNLIEK
jgi:hypothetical protein